MTSTCRFGVRRYPNGGSAVWFEVFDRMTGAAVASGLGRVEAEDDARQRNRDTGGHPMVAVRLGSADLTVLRAAVGAYLSRAGHDHSRVVHELSELFAGGPSEHG